MSFSFLQDPAEKRFFQAITAVCAGILLLALFFSAFHAVSLRSVLLERELSLTSALLEQGTPPAAIADAIAHTEVSPDARSLLDRLGRDPHTPFWLLAPVRKAAARFLRAALLLALPLLLALLAVTLRCLQNRDQLLRSAAASLARYADGDFSRRLPAAQTGALHQLFDAAEQLATALQSKSESEHNAREFLKETISDISHQLKTPLAALRMYAEIIAAEPDEPETVCSFTEKSLAALARMEGLIGSLLKIARLDAGSIAFAQEPVLAADLAARAAGELQTRAAQEGKRLTLSGDPALALCCDPGWTAEALGNLLKNALDHTAPGDTVAVRWAQSPALVRLTVEDTGEGIAPADLHHIFKRFYRGPSAMGPKGVGLGLPLARAVVEGQGGVLSVQSEPGKGTVFTISFQTNLTKL